MRFTFLSILIACSSKTIPEAAQCGEMEQDIFLSCLDAQCSASYQQSLAGTDACAVDGSTNTISVEASGSCGFSSSGSCFVICDCPEGAVLAVDVEEMDDGDDEGDDESSVECLTVDSPEWTALQAEVTGLKSNVTDLTSQLDTLSMNVGRIDLNVDNLSAAVDEHSTDLESLHTQTDALDAAVGDTPVVISSWQISCVESLPLVVYWWNPYPSYYTETVTDAEICVIGYGFDSNDPPYSVGFVSYQDYTAAFYTQPVDSGIMQNCNAELGNPYCFYGQAVDYPYTILDTGELVTMFGMARTDTTFIVTIIDDKEYFAP